jgi:hypothetical protein
MDPNSPKFAYKLLTLLMRKLVPNQVLESSSKLDTTIRRTPLPLTIESEPDPLFLPVSRRSFPKLLHCEIYRLLTIQDRFYDVGRQECRMENLRDIPFVEPSCFADRAAPRHSTGDDLLIPVVSSCNCLD